jgi:RHS repeat-associated protein
LKQLVNRKSATSIISRHDYLYDGFGNRKSHAEKIGSDTINYTYAYDNLNRLVQVATGTPRESFTYDPLGNRRGKTVDAPPPVFYIYDAANQLLETRSGSATGTMLQAFVYDAAGNLTKKAEGGTVTRTATDCTGATVTSFTYDTLNRLTQVAQTGPAAADTERYAYDHEGRRIQKIVGTTQNNYQYMGPDIYAEYGRVFATSPKALYTHGPSWDDPILTILRPTGLSTTPTTKYFHQDGLGSVVALSTETGTTAATQRFDAWGARTTGTGTVALYGYTGREPDATGLTYYRARYYDPSIGRFTQRDPIGFRGGINPYAYCQNNPVNFNDPNGLLPRLAGVWCYDQTQSYFSTLGPGFTDILPGIASAVSQGANAVSDIAENGHPLAKGALGLAYVTTVGPVVAATAMSGGGSGGVIAPRGIANEIPSTLARVVQGERTLTTLGRPGTQDVFVTAADDIAGMNAAQLSRLLTIDPSDAFSVIRFPTPSSGLATPINRLDNVFIGGGRTAGGAREFVLPN